MTKRTESQLDLFDLMDGTLAAAEAAEQDTRRRAPLIAERWNADPLHRVRRESEWVCGRCGELYHSARGGHDAGYLGCKVGTDPVWRYYPRRTDGLGSGPYGLALRDDHQLSNDEMCIRWDANQWPMCTCGHPFGVHVHQHGIAPVSAGARLSCLLIGCRCSEYSETP